MQDSLTFYDYCEATTGKCPQVSTAHTMWASLNMYGCPTNERTPMKKATSHWAPLAPAGGRHLRLLAGLPRAGPT